MPITKFIEGRQREINCFSGRYAYPVGGKREPIFEGYTPSGYAREYLLSELTRTELLAAAAYLLREIDGRPVEQAANVVDAVSAYGDIDGFVRQLCAAWRKED